VPGPGVVVPPAEATTTTMAAVAMFVGSAPPGGACIGLKTGCMAYVIPPTAVNDTGLSVLIVEFVPSLISQFTKTKLSFGVAVIVTVAPSV